jgi:hypothetical protein
LILPSLQWSSDASLTHVLAAVDHKSRELGKLEAFFAGGIARGVAAAATVPFTIAKTRMEYQGPNAQIYKVVILASEWLLSRGLP